MLICAGVEHKDADVDFLLIINLQTISASRKGSTRLICKVLTIKNQCEFTIFHSYISVHRKVQL